MRRKAEDIGEDKFICIKKYKVKEDLVFYLGRLGYSLVTPGVPEVGEDQVVELLAELLD